MQLAVEPTSLACLGLLTSAGDEPMEGLVATSRDAANWMSGIQQADGSLPVSRISRRQVGRLRTHCSCGAG